MGRGRFHRSRANFLTDSMPTYASVLCGPLREKIDSLVIEGHTDDRGSDFNNLRLSQERSFSVMAKGLEVIAEAVPWAYSCFYQKTSASGRGRQDLVYEGANVSEPRQEPSRDFQDPSAVCVTSHLRQHIETADTSVLWSRAHLHLHRATGSEAVAPSIAQRNPTSFRRADGA